MGEFGRAGPIASAGNVLRNGRVTEGVVLAPLGAHSKSHRLLVLFNFLDHLKANR